MTLLKRQPNSGLLGAFLFLLCTGLLGCSSAVTSNGQGETERASNLPEQQGTRRTNGPVDKKSVPGPPADASDQKAASQPDRTRTYNSPATVTLPALEPCQHACLAAEEKCSNTCTGVHVEIKGDCTYDCYTEGKRCFARCTGR